MIIRLSLYYVLHTNCCQLTFSCSSDLFGETSDDSAGGVMLIEGMWQFLASSLQLLPQGEAVQHNSILEDKKVWWMITLCV